ADRADQPRVARCAGFLAPPTARRLERLLTHVDDAARELQQVCLDTRTELAHQHDALLQRDGEDDGRVGFELDLELPLEAARQPVAAAEDRAVSVADRPFAELLPQRHLWTKCGDIGTK